MTVFVGDVFRFYCHFPETSKEKMMVLVKKKPYTFFMINSKANAFNAYTLSCQVDVPYVGHEQFLTHDSSANCVDKVDTVNVIRDSQLAFNRIETHKVGAVESYVLRNIIDVLENTNRTLPNQLKREIIVVLKAREAQSD